LHSGSVLLVKVPVSISVLFRVNSLHYNSFYLASDLAEEIFITSFVSFI